VISVIQRKEAIKLNLKVRNYFKYIVSTMIVLILPVVILFSATLYYAYDHEFYMGEFQKYNLDKAVGISMDDMSLASKELITFIKGKRPTLEDVPVTYKEKSVNFFNQREMQHMDDVVILFNYVNIIRNGLIIILLVYGVINWQTAKKRKSTLSNYGFGSLFSLLICGIVVGVSYLDFSKYFTYFHETFFTNDLWLLNPKTDMLIRMLPLEFFIDMVTKIVTASIVVSIAIALISFVLSRRIGEE
jgi:integral membrane protein (TIGR01906 family)